MRAHAEEQRFERLPGPVNADVRLRRGRQHAAQRIERLGADRGAVHALAVARALRVAALEVLLHRRDPLRVQLEGLVHHRGVAVAQRTRDFVRDVIPPPSVQLVGVGNVSSGLFEVRHQPSPLEHLGEDVRHVLARDVRSAQLRDRVVAVLVEDPVVQLFGARRPTFPTDAAAAGISPANSSRNNRRSDFAERE